MRPPVGPFSRALLAGTAGLVLALAGCDEATDSPVGPAAEPAPALATAAAGTLAFRQLDVGSEFACGVTVDDLAYCWGSNSAGQLGDGTLADHPTPVPVSGGHHFKEISTGGAHACGLRTDNRVYCWGWNLNGQVGDSSTSQRRPTPSRVYGGRFYKQVRAGSSHTCGLTTGGETYCWGSNLDGKLGINSSVIRQRLYPVKVAGGLTFTAINVGALHSCGRVGTGKAYCWGVNSNGRLGDGTTVTRLSPRAVIGGRLFDTINAGGGHTCGVATTGITYCWGFNLNGQLGDGTTTDRLVPTRVTGGLTFARVSAGNAHTCGVTSGHVVYCWGANQYGQLGNGSSNASGIPTPTRTFGDLTFEGVTAGFQSTCGVATGTNRVAYCWGRNHKGQLGNGTTSDSYIPFFPVGGS